MGQKTLFCSVQHWKICQKNTIIYPIKDALDPVLIKRNIGKNNSQVQVSTLENPGSSLGEGGDIIIHCVYEGVLWGLASVTQKGKKWGQAEAEGKSAIDDFG